MTAANSSTSTNASPAPLPEHPIVCNFNRLAGHARLIAAGLLLVYRSSLFAMFVLLWPAVTEPWGGSVLPEQLTEVMVTAALTVWCMQFLMPWQSRLIRTAGLTLAGILVWVSIAALLFWDQPMVSRPEHLLRVASAIVAGGVTAALAARYAAMLLQGRDPAPISEASAPAPPFTRFCPACAAVLGDAEVCPACGRHTPRPDLAPALQRERTRMRIAWERSLFGLRCLALLVGTAALLGLGCTWAGQFRPDTPDALAELLAWVFVGLISGAGVGFLAIHRSSRLATATAAGVMLLAHVAGAVLASIMLLDVHLSAFFWQVAGLATLVAAGTALLTHVLLSAIVGRLVPVGAAQLLLGRPVRRPARAAPPAPPPSPRTCEGCGYQLEGLPAARCGQCGVVALRCPECGHIQPANALNARALRILYRFHIALRVVYALAGTGGVLLLLAPWMLLAPFLGRDLLRDLSWTEYLALLLVSFILVSPIRLLLLHGRWLWLKSLLVALLPAAVVVARGSTGRLDAFYMTVWVVTVLFLPCWLVVCFTTPYLWRVWLWLMYGSAIGGEVFRWHRAPAYRHGSTEQILADPDHVLGRELPLHCGGCGSPVPGGQTETCPACGIHSLTCPTCQEHHGIAAVRIGFESLLHRTRLLGLALLAALAAAAMGFLVIADVSNGESLSRLFVYSDWNGNSYLSNAIASGILCALAFGIVGRLVLIRRPLAAVIVPIALLHALAYAAAPQVAGGGLYALTGFGEATLFLGLLMLISGILALPAIMLGKPLLHMALYLLPQPFRRPLFGWVIGRQTLDQAADLLPAEVPA